MTRCKQREGKKRGRKREGVICQSDNGDGEVTGGRDKCLC